MKIIGHRGAAGLALENTLDSFKAAIEAGVDAIEFDIRITKDGKLVLSHDSHLGRVSKKSAKITESSLAILRQVKLNNGKAIVTLAEALEKTKEIPLIIEPKESEWAEPLTSFLKQQKDISHCKVISFNHQELYAFHLLMPKVPVFALEHTKPFEVIRIAKVLGFTGIDINFWLLNPLTYYLARYHKLEVIVYTVNSPWIASFLRFMYPRISITTDVPDRLQFLRKVKRLRKARSRHSQ